MRSPPWLPALLLALAASAGLLLAPRLLLAAWLAAWWWGLGIVLGCFVNAWLHRLTGGDWGAPLRAAALRLARLSPWLLLGLLPVAIGHATLYPWAGAGDAWLHAYGRPAFVQAWLAPGFFLARLLAYALLWWWLLRPASLASKPRAAIALLLHTFVGSLAAVDLLASLLPQWFSTGFGLVVLSAQALSGAAAAVLLAVPAAGLPHAEAARVPPSRDLGNLLLMWTMLWAYLAFMQFLIIWAENLPREIAWYVPRLQSGWRFAGIALVVLQLVLPFALLLLRAVKDRPARLRRVAALVLAASALDAAWMVIPSVDARSWHACWLVPLLFAATALLVLGPATATAPELLEVRHGT